MRTAYSGRAAAYEKKGDYRHAIVDHNMVVLLFAVEIEVLNDQDAPERDKFMLEAAQAYRARGNALREVRRTDAADADVKHAETLEADARKLAKAASDKAAKPAEGIVGRLQLVNNWTKPVTIVIGDIEYKLEPGEQKIVARPAGPFTYELRGGAQERGTGSLKAGQIYRIRVVGQ
jgi:hypothetical protein